MMMLSTYAVAATRLLANANRQKHHPLPVTTRGNVRGHPVNRTRRTASHRRAALVTRAAAVSPAPDDNVSSIIEGDVNMRTTLHDVHEPLLNVRQPWPTEHHGYLWSLVVDQDWCATNMPHVCEFLETLDLTEAIDTHRTGPNQTGKAVVGKDETRCDLTVFKGISMSPQHAAFEEDGDGNLFVTDLKSGNGTFVNDQHIKAFTKRQVFPGDKISFGHMTSPMFVVNRNIFAHA